jgi:hypothetical protein
MLRQSIRSFKSIALGFALCSIAAGAAGCSESSTDTDSDADNVRITADQTDTLAANQFYKVDLTKSDVVYAFNYSDRPIAYDRIHLVTPKGELLLSDEMKMVEAGDYGDYPQPNLLGASDKQFLLSADAAAFGVLTEAELATLKTNGFFYDEKALEAPQATPQSTDNCIHATCEFCFENGTNSPPVSWQPGTYHCYYEEHVWCD